MPNCWSLPFPGCDCSTSARPSALTLASSLMGHVHFSATLEWSCTHTCLSVTTRACPFSSTENPIYLSVTHFPSLSRRIASSPCALRASYIRSTPSPWLTRGGRTRCVLFPDFAVSRAASALLDVRSMRPAVGFTTAPSSPLPRPDMKPAAPPSEYPAMGFAKMPANPSESSLAKSLRCPSMLPAFLRRAACASCRFLMYSSSPDSCTRPLDMDPVILLAALNTP
mmetsp:Transcript_12881/g.31596  ORF Transcript_12881/g.31596 Transcript_12881/m.31596 type:complete len:225 (+) Transcript_12881:276-950(+)